MWPFELGRRSRHQIPGVFPQDFTIVLAAERQGVPPDVKLDGMYKFMEPWHWQCFGPIDNGNPLSARVKLSTDDYR